MSAQPMKLIDVGSLLVLDVPDQHATITLTIEDAQQLAMMLSANLIKRGEGAAGMQAAYQLGKEHLAAATLPQHRDPDTGISTGPTSPYLSREV
ncbi:hypothetical protein [Leucobacter sp. cx-169]|uniref:hypothetical protein n=1 Tax=Leucobacter sp. cx-169 TaxID=2770549 RepID=UPI00165E3645|nr:hypothetical protein [Leucobacter sp. cx-169]MBC9927220.1 hypothetical protein [Leucobacter sp. cx-169]